MKARNIFILYFLSCHFFCFSQLEEVWSKSFYVNQQYFDSPMPKIQFDTNGELVLVGNSYVVKYDTLGNELWWKQFDGEAYAAFAGGNMDHFTIDEQNNIYIISNKEVLVNPDTLNRVFQVQKYSPTGEELWVSEYQYYPYFSNDEAFSIIHDNENIYVTGKSTDTINYVDMLLLAFDRETGIEKWESRFHDDENDADRGNRIMFDMDGDLIIGGKSSTSSNNEFMLWKYDTLGNMIWQRDFENQNTLVNLFTDMDITSDNNIVMTGYYYTTISYSNQGNFQWFLTPPTNLPFNTTGDHADEILALDNGDVIVTGYHTDYIGNQSDSDVLTLRINSNGEVVWSARYDIENVLRYDNGRGIAVDSNGDIYIVGNTAIEENGNFDGDFLILKYEGSTGELLWDFVDDQNANEFDYLFSVIPSENSLYVSGIYSENGSNQFVTKKYNEVPVSNKNISDEEISLQFFPNPTSDILNIKMENPSFANLSIFDIYGKKVLEKNEVNQNEIQLSTSNFSSGIYFLKIEMEGKELVKKFIKM